MWFSYSRCRISLTFRIIIYYIVLIFIILNVISLIFMIISMIFYSFFTFIKREIDIFIYSFGNTTSRIIKHHSIFIWFFEWKLINILSIFCVLLLGLIDEVSIDNSVDPNYFDSVSIQFDDLVWLFLEE